MSIQTEITRLQTARNTLRTKGLDLGIVTGTDKLDVIATAFNGIANCGAVSANVKEGETYTIPKGYHNGSGTVSGVAGGGSYELQSKTVSPTKLQQNITPDSGYYGLSDVTVSPIPDQFQDVSSVTAGAGDVLANKVFVTSDGTVTTGTMPNNGAVSKVLDTATKSYAIPAGYHNGSGSVSITTETKTATPTKSEQSITPTTGNVLEKVTVGAIPDEYQVVTGVTATAEHVLEDDVFVNTEGEEVVGTMPNHGSVSQTLDTGTTSFQIQAGYHDGTGSVSISLEEKTATPTKSAQTITPTAGKVLSKVTVAAIPAEYITTSDANALATDILAMKTAYVNGVKVTGTMANNGAVGGEIDGLVTSSMEIPAGYTSGGTVSLNGDIEAALAAI